MKTQLVIYGLCFALLGLSNCVHRSETVKVSGLRTEQKDNPLGVNIERPRFSWRISSSAADLIQTGYRIQVATSVADLLAAKDLIWDSGEVVSGQSLYIPYDGPDLVSQQRYYWRVKVNTNQATTGWSEPQYWQMALADDEWKAKWIGENAMSNSGETAKDPTRLAARYLRKCFEVAKPVEKATLYLSGLGSSESFLNGKRISEDVFAPVPSLFPSRVYYNTYDVSALLSEGENALGVLLGNGRYFAMRTTQRVFGLPCLLAQLEITYTDGTQERIVSDESWKVTSKGPILANNEFDGEEYDARLEMKGWNEIGFDDSAWQPMDLMEAPGGKVVAQQTLNIQVQDTLVPVQVMARSDGKYVLDMGQNMVGWLGVKLTGKAGKPVTMRFAEMLNADTTLYVANLRSARATDIYTPASDGAFQWKPSLTYHGFRYVELSGIDYVPKATDFAGYVLYDRMATTGRYASSNALMDQLHQNAFWGIRGNYRGMPTDCPQRDERLGWLGDRTTGASGEAYLFDNCQLYTKWLQDIEDSMSPEGHISDVSPSYWILHQDNVTWPAAFIYVAEMLYRHYGDDQPIRTHYPAMKRWVERVRGHAMEGGVVVKDVYGDWCMPPEEQHLIHSQDPARKTNGAILGTTVFYGILHKMARFAELVGKPDDAKDYLGLADQMKKAYNEKFFNPETAQYGNNTVTANLLSLRMGLVPEGQEQRVFDNIVRKTEVDFGGHVSTGVVGIQHLMRGLTENGRKDLAYRIANNEDYPSWGYMIRKGATTIWELWNGDTADPSMNSANHVMLLGDLLIWYYEDLAGIKNAADSQGFKHIEMAPIFPDGLDHVDASYDSVYGRIESAWERKENRLTWRVTIPGNTTATLRVPKTFRLATAGQDGIHKVEETDSEQIIEIGSGSYLFQSE